MSSSTPVSAHMVASHANAAASLLEHGTPSRETASAVATAAVHILDRYEAQRRREGGDTPSPESRLVLRAIKQLEGALIGASHALAGHLVKQVASRVTERTAQLETAATRGARQAIEEDCALLHDARVTLDQLHAAHGLLGEDRIQSDRGDPRAPAIRSEPLHSLPPAVLERAHELGLNVKRTGDLLDRLAETLNYQRYITGDL